jgi:hypothetical protein
MRKVAMTLGLASALLLLLMLAVQTHAAPAAPAARHCGDAGPLPWEDPNFCGCTWGEVLFHGQPVPGAAITLTYGSGVVTDVTLLTELEPDPYFDLTARDLGAHRWDVLTLTARCTGQTISRAIRAYPGADGEQHVVLAFPERGVWSTWVTGGYTRALALDGDTVWAGGPAGVISISLSTGVSVVHTLPWPEPLVRALVVGTDGHVWAAGDSGVAEFDGSAWHTHAVPLAGTPRALAVDPFSGAIWLGGGDATGGVAVYTGTWWMVKTFNAKVTAMAVDDEGYAWAGTWEEGAYRQDGNGGWTPHLVDDGLASNNVLAAVAGDGAIWFGTSPYLSGQGPRGGIARYDLSTGTWRVYTTAHGLPADAKLSPVPGPVYALGMGEDGIPWAGTADGVWFQACGDWWAGYTTTHGLRPGAVMALVVENGTAVAAPPAGLGRLDATFTTGAAPMAQTDLVSPLQLTKGTTLTLEGRGWDRDEGGSRIVAWDWSSSPDGPLCTSVTCTLPYTLFTLGGHSISLQVQDDEGMWSSPATETIVVGRQVFLPLVLRLSQGS